MPKTRKRWQGIYPFNRLQPHTFVDTRIVALTVIRIDYATNSDNLMPTASAVTKKLKSKIKGLLDIQQPVLPSQKGRTEIRSQQLIMFRKPRKNHLLSGSRVLVHAKIPISVIETTKIEGRKNFRKHVSFLLVIHPS